MTTPHNPLTSARDAGVAVHDDNADLFGGVNKMADVLRVIYGLHDQAYNSGPAYDRWIERAEHVFHYPSTAKDFAEYALDLPPAFAMLFTPQPSATCAENAQGDEMERQKPEDYSPQPTKHLETWMREAAVAHGDSYPLLTKRFIEVADYMANADAKSAELHNLWVFWRNDADERSKGLRKAIRRAEQAEARERALLDNNEAERQNLRRINAENAALKAEVERLREALTPSPETKAAYMGEFSFSIDDCDEDGLAVLRSFTVPWTTIKEIMAAISARAHEQKGGV